MAVQHKQQCMPNVSGGRILACCAKGPGFEPASPGYKHRRRTQESSLHLPLAADQIS